MNYQLEDTIDDLYSCGPNDRKKFNEIMLQLKQKFIWRAKPMIKKKPCKIKPPPIYKIEPIPPLRNINNYMNLFKRRSNSIITNENIKTNDYVPPKPININYNLQNFNTQRNFYPSFDRFNLNENKKDLSNGFQGTLPDALYIKNIPIRTNSLQKLLSDTHANTKFYCPKKEVNLDNDNLNDWHNHMNNIMFNTSENFYI